MQIKRYARKPLPQADFSYNGVLGNWWMKRAADCAHQRAYRNIATFIQGSCRRAPRLILDYACGAGNLLSLLSRRFARSRLIGLDGSSFLLDLAEQRLSRLPKGCKQRITLIETSLPGKSVLAEKADLVVYCFPNMVPDCSREKIEDAGFRLSKGEQRIAHSLSRANRHMLEFNRIISRNLRQTMVRGGLCVRAEYATTRRHEWSQLEMLQVSFEEGSLDTAVDGIKLRPWFRVLASAYFRSKAVEDVYEQSGDKRDRNGGYLITVLRAI